MGNGRRGGAATEDEDAAEDAARDARRATAESMAGDWTLRTASIELCLKPLKNHQPSSTVNRVNKHNVVLTKCPPNTR